MHDNVKEKFLALEESLFKAWNDYLALKDEYKKTFETVVPVLEPIMFQTTPLTPEQADIIRDDLEGIEDITQTVLRHYQINSIDDLPQEEFKLIRLNIKRIKRNYLEGSL